MSETNIQHECLADALAAAQAEFGEIKKGRTAKIKTKSGGEYEYHYADLSDVLDATRPHLNKHGIAVTWKSDGQSLRCILLWKKETYESDAVPLFYERTMQGLGSAMTYARRYSFCGLIGVVAEDDDDGAGAGEPPKQQEHGHANGSARNNTPPPEERHYTDGAKLISAAKAKYASCTDAAGIIATIAAIGNAKDKFERENDWFEALNWAMEYIGDDDASKVPLATDEMRTVSKMMDHYLGASQEVPA